MPVWKIRRCAMQTTILTLALILFCPVVDSAAKDFNLSKEMKTLLQQMQSTYVSRLGTHINNMASKDPMTFASFLGVTLQRQAKYMHVMEKYSDELG